MQGSQSGNLGRLRPAVFVSCVTLAAFALAGCNDGGEGAAEQVSSAVETATEAIPETIEVELAEQDPGYSGRATLEPNDDGTLNVTIEISGHQDEPHPAHIHEGSCPDLVEGDVESVEVAPLNDVVGGTSTTENIEFSLDDVASADSPGYAIDVHHSDLLTTVVACGDVTHVSLRHSRWGMNRRRVRPAEAAAACLRNAGVSVETAEDEFAYIAERGASAFRAAVGENDVTVVVERSVYDAHETERGYELLGIGNLRERRGPSSCGTRHRPTGSEGHSRAA